MAVFCQSTLGSQTLNCFPFQYIVSRVDLMPLAIFVPPAESETKHSSVWIRAAMVSATDYILHGNHGL